MAVGSTVSTAFTTMWSDDVTQLAQQTASKLQGAVRTVRGVVGETYKFHTLGKGGYLKNKLRNADIRVMSDSAAFSAPTDGTSYTGSTAAHAVVSASMNSFVTGEYIEDIDQLRTNIDYKRSYQEAIAAALNRAYDTELITVMDAASPAAVQCSSGLVLGKLVEVAEALNLKDIPNEDRFLVISPKALTDMLNVTTLVSSDYVATQGLATGYIPNVMGFNIIVSNLLSIDGPSSTRSCYAFHKNAVGCGIGKDITSRFDYVPQKVAHLVTAEFTQGCAIIDTDGLIEVQVVE
jgi:hypothetical protein